ncbi:MAG: nuclease, partial [Cyanobacteria bacterium]|nr:nuclease [Cyanobacteriota bacterium]MDW8200222.1 nuclease [Cyanobacteriota bacterium SKYGB_h_bin112]
HYTIHADVVGYQSRPRLPELDLSTRLDPLAALQTYLSDRQDLQDIAADMLAAAQTLLANDDEVVMDFPADLTAIQQFPDRSPDQLSEPCSSSIQLSIL